MPTPTSPPKGAGHTKKDSSKGSAERSDGEAPKRSSMIPKGAGHAKKDSGKWSIECNKDETPKISSPEKGEPQQAPTHNPGSPDENLRHVGKWAGHTS